MRTSALFDAKNSDILKLMTCPYGQGGGAIFRDFVRTSFMDGPLSYCSYKKVI